MKWSGNNISRLNFSMSSRKRHTVLLTRNDFPQPAVDLLKESCNVEWLERPNDRDALLKSVAGKDGLYCMAYDVVDQVLLDTTGPQLKVIGTLSAGYDHLDLNEIKKRGIAVGYIPDVQTGTVAEYTIALTLAVARSISESHQDVVNGEWFKAKKNKLWTSRSTLIGATVGIVGLGRIGLATAKRLLSFDVAKILYTGPSPKPEAAEVSGQFVTLGQLLKESDFVVVTCSLNESTRKLFGPAQFAAMKPNSIFINTSRGGVVDQDALAEALKSGRIAAAGLDVSTPEPLPDDHELTKLRNCVLTPHIAYATEQNRTAMAVMNTRNILCALQGTPMPAQLC